jgi:hypothetical protein
MKSNRILSLLVIQLALTTKAFKTIDLCLEKTPRNGRHNWYPNKYQMRDLMTEAAKANENRLLQEEDYYNSDENKPNSTERSHIGSKTPVLGSIALITGNYRFKK